MTVLCCSFVHWKRVSW